VRAGEQTSLPARTVDLSTDDRSLSLYAVTGTSEAELVLCNRGTLNKVHVLKEVIAQGAAQGVVEDITATAPVTTEKVAGEAVVAGDAASAAAAWTRGLATGGVSSREVYTGGVRTSEAGLGWQSSEIVQHWT